MKNNILFIKNDLNFNTISILIFIFACFSSFLLLKATTWGIGLTTDSIAYIEGARSILRNQNFSDLSSHYPPLYFFLISLSSIFSSDILLSTKWLQIFTIFLHTCIIGYIIFQETQYELIWALLGMFVFSTSTTVLQIHSMAWSEASFCIFSLLGLYYLSKYQQIGTEVRWLFYAGVLVAMAFLTRYSGVTLICTGIIFIFSRTQKSFRTRILHSIIFTSFALSLISIWFVRNIIANVSITNRQLIFHPISIEKIINGIQVFLSWFQISSFNLSIALGLIFMLLIAYYIISFKYQSFEIPFIQLSLLFISVYIPFLIISISFFDAHTPLDGRILFPAYDFLLIAILLMLHKLLSTIGNEKIFNIFNALFIVSILIFSAFQFFAQAKFIETLESDGLGFSSKEWVQSELLEYIKKLPESTLIWTNGPDPIQLYLNRSSKMLPKVIDPITQKTNPQAMKEIKNTITELIEKGGVLVLFNNITWRWYLANIQQIASIVQLEEISQAQDGVIYRVNGPIFFKEDP